MENRAYLFVLLFFINVIFSINSSATYNPTPEEITPKLKITCGTKTALVRPKDLINQCPLHIALGETAIFSDDGSYDKDSSLDGKIYFQNDDMKNVGWSLIVDGYLYESNNGFLVHEFNSEGLFYATANIDDLPAVADDDNVQIETSVMVMQVDYIIVLPNPLSMGSGGWHNFVAHAFNYGDDGERYYDEYGNVIEGRPADDIKLAASFDWDLWGSPVYGTLYPTVDCVSTQFSAYEVEGTTWVRATYNKQENPVSGYARIDIYGIDYIIVLPNPGICVPSGTIDFSAKAYSNGENQIRDLDDQGNVIKFRPCSDDILLSGTFQWSLNPSTGFGQISTGLGDETTFTSNGSTGTGTITATYDGSNVNKSVIINVVSIIINLKEFGVAGTNEHSLYKANSGFWGYDPFETGGSVAITDPIWQSDVEYSNPVCFTKHSTPKLTNIKMEFEQNIEEQINAKIMATLISPSGSILFNKDVVLSGQEIEINEMTTTNTFYDFVGWEVYSHEWKISYDGGSNWELIYNSDGDTRKCIDVFLTYSTPNGWRSAKRLSLVAFWAQTQNTLEGIVHAVGPYSTTHDLFDVDYNYASNPWKVLDGNNADCETLSYLMKASLELIGIVSTEAEIRYVYSRHASWTGIWSTSKSAYELNPSTSEKLKFWNGCLNNWEGCCYVIDEWWPGGVGASSDSANAVLMGQTQPNEDGIGDPPWPKHQCWDSHRAIHVDYPD